ncbi:MAG: hypothetical protein OIN87_05125 [Candidatus Methanoperedens sp.]|nr:hypothetical protein [Candidatus Methanoperedens sp.]
MADEVKKSVKPKMPDEKAAKEAANATLLALAKTDAQKAAAVKAPSAVEVRTPAAVAVKTPSGAAVKVEERPVIAVPKVESKKEADPNKEFVDGIMSEMALKGASKKRLIKMLAEKFHFDKQKVMFRLKRALITERYAAAHAEAGH